MHHTIEILYQGNPEILEWYKRARDRWNAIFKEIDPLDGENLAERLTHEQKWFERNCGGKYIGREIMVVTSVAQFYSTESGFDDSGAKAKSIIDAFARSLCSGEVKGKAKSVAESYNLT
jgi:hypothetical protein